MRSSVLGTRRVAHLAGTAAFVAAGALLLAPGAGAQSDSPSAAPPAILDGPSANIVGLSGMSVARDGTGGLVYLKDVGGVAHVFVSQLAGRFQPPQQIDAGLAGASSQPVIAAGNRGLLLIAFINGGQLYVVDRTGTNAGYGAPSALAAGASNPTIAITNLGKAYLAFTMQGDGGHDVRCAYYYQGSWGLESGPLDAVPSDDAGTATGRPAVTASGDGVGIVAWGENGHIYTRRLWATAPSVVYEQADVPSLNGWHEVSSSDPALGTGGDSSYAAVAFREDFASGAAEQSRVLMQQLRGSVYTGVAQADGLSTPGGDGADQPQVAVGEYGSGFVTSERTTSHELTALRLKNNAVGTSVSRVDSLPNSSAPFGTVAPLGYRSDLVAWQENPVAGAPEIRARFFDGFGFSPEQVLSSPAMGPTDAADGLVVAGDVLADGAVAWVQGQSGARSIVVAQLFQPPGSFAPLKRFRYARTARPTLSWSPVRQTWGPIRYTVSVDGATVTSTTATSVRVPVALAQGRHRWQVSATNPAGLASSAGTAAVFVDTIAPRVHVRLIGPRTAGALLELRVHATDAVGVPRSRSSGIKSVRVKWGDGTHSRIQRIGSHVYSAAGRYRITVIVTDRAGNVRRVVIKVQETGSSARRRAKHARR